MAVVLRGFVGRIRQLPPMHSALKHAGRPLYEYARAGQVIDREPREVEIKAIEMLGLEGSRLRLRVLCSKGTYIRTLAQDIGAIAGCGAWLSSLRRVAVGELRIAQAVGLDELQSLTPEQRRTTLLPIDALLSSLEQLELDAETAGRFMHGQRIRWRATGTDLEARRVAVRGPGGLLGLAHLDDGLLTPVRLIAQTSLPASPAGVATHV
jgi:tRNA pseudouridine55 synthase